MTRVLLFPSLPSAAGFCLAFPLRLSCVAFHRDILSCPSRLRAWPRVAVDGWGPGSRRRADLADLEACGPGRAPWGGGMMGKGERQAQWGRGVVDRKERIRGAEEGVTNPNQ